MNFRFYGPDAVPLEHHNQRILDQLDTEDEDPYGRPSVWWRGLTGVSHPSPGDSAVPGRVGPPSAPAQAVSPRQHPEGTR